mgnify:CR=1 FL=1
MNLQVKANEIMRFLNNLPQVKACELYGSCANGNADKYSDVDIKVDVSGSDNGAFMLSLPEIIVQKSPLLWYDYAPSLAPEQYVVSIAIDENNPFCVVDFKCVATPHIDSIQKGDLNNDTYTHLIKLWIANCKHFIRGADCSADIQKMGRRTIGKDCERMTDSEILEKILCRLENNATELTKIYIENCRKVWDERWI